MPVRVLHVITGLKSGGAESFIMNMYRNMDHSKVQFDFLLRSSDNYYEDELSFNGSYVFVTAPFPRHMMKNYLQVVHFFQSHHYDIIHVHGNALLYTSVLRIAKHAGIQCRIMHSHNTGTKKNLYLPLHMMNKKSIHSWATNCFACSQQAGEWMFGDGFQIIHNAIDLDRFQFNVVDRKVLRLSYHIPDDALVIGHIGRFSKQKNHRFLLDIFSSVINMQPDSYLVLLGEGELESEIHELVHSKGLQDKVLILGVRKDVERIMNMFDLFLFPSLYEGLSVVVMEVQANGLHMICSEATPQEILVSEKSFCMSLKEGAEAWAKKLLTMDTTREDCRVAICEKGYDIKSEAKKLESFYLSHAINIK